MPLDRAHRVLSGALSNSVGTPSSTNPGWNYSNLVLSSLTLTIDWSRWWLLYASPSIQRLRSYTDSVIIGLGQPLGKISLFGGFNELQVNSYRVYRVDVDSDIKIVAWHSPEHLYQGVWCKSNTHKFRQTFQRIFCWICSLYCYTRKY